MAVTAWKTGTSFTTASPGGFGSANWSNASTATLSTSDDTYATSAPSKSGASTYWLRMTNMGFTASDIPVGSVIDGIEVQIEKKQNTAGRTCPDKTVQLWNGSDIGANQALAGNYPTTDTTFIYGGATDTWGATLTQEIVCSSGFGLSFAAGNVNGSTTISVDYIAMRVHYSADTEGPVWTSNNSIAVNENSPLSFTLRATDASTVSYSLVGGADQAHFEVSGSTLRFASNGTRDFEAPQDADGNNIYEVIARATDANGNYTDQTIDLTVLDFTPVITSPNNATVLENATLAHPLTVSSGSVVWSIIGGEDAAQFELSGNTLRWVNNGVKDFESPSDTNSDNQYIVVVRAAQGNDTVDQTIIVSVVDQTDENPPVITNGSGFTVYENTALNVALTANETVTWSVDGGDDAAQFEVSGSTLRWKSNGTQDFENPSDANADNVYHVIVRATDNGTPAANSSTKPISVTVLDLYEPERTQTITTTGPGSFTLPEGTTSLTVEAWGAGGGANATDVAMAGGGGGSYVRQSYSASAGDTVYWTVGAGVVNAAGESSAFNFNNSDLTLEAGAYVAGGGQRGTSNPGTGGVPSIPSGATGYVAYNGGNGGNAATGGGGGGGGGGAGSQGNGGTGSNGEAPGSFGSANGGSGGSGGQPDGGNGGAGGSRSSWGGGIYSNGSNGTAPGGGSGGGSDDATGSVGGASPSTGGQGQIRLTYVVPDTTPPTITSQNFNSVLSNRKLAHQLTASEPVTWTITGGVDQALFEINGATLRWLDDGVMTSGPQNTYTLDVTATDLAGNSTTQTITVTVRQPADSTKPRRYMVL